MKAMLEPRIVAASTQRCAVLAQGDVAGAAERMDASTQGSWIAMAMKGKKPKSGNAERLKHSNRKQKRVGAADVRRP